MDTMRRRRSVSVLWPVRRATAHDESSSSSSGGFVPRRRLSANSRAPVVPSFSSDVAARAYLARQRPHSARRALPDAEGTPLRLVCTVAGGDCGFEAVAWGIALTRGAGPSSREVRRVLAQHVYSQRDAYVRACGSARQVDQFCRGVMKTGLLGHWLGATWGALEIVAVARAIGVTIRVYTFDVRTQRFRCYFEEMAGGADEQPVRLLFSGDADRGHFDCLVPEAKSLLPALWRRRFVRKLQTVAPAVA